MSMRTIRITYFLAIVAGAAWVTVLSIGLSSQVRSTHRLARQGKQAHDSLCVLKADLARRITDADEFLRQHPHGIPGIPAKAIQASLTNQRSTLTALETLTCP